VFRKFLFIFFLSIFIFVFACSAYASGDAVSGLIWDIPESSDYPNHTYIFIYRLETGNQSTSGVFMVKYYMPIVLKDISTTTSYALRLNCLNALYYKYNSDSDTFELSGNGLQNVNFIAFYKDSDNNYVRWDDPNVVIGLFPLASNHNIKLDDGTLFFWTPQQNTNSHLLYRLPVTEMMKTLLIVGGRTFGVALMIFGIVLGVLWVKRLISWFLR